MFTNILKKTIRRACYAYTIMSFLYLIIMLDLYRTAANPYPGTIMRFLPFVFLIALANTIVTETKIKKSLKILAHFLIVTSDIVFFVWFPARTLFSAGTVLLLFVIYVILYIAGTSIILLVLSAKKKKRELNSEYQEVYSTTKRK